jgi:hypothetical protein
MTPATMPRIAFRSAPRVLLLGLLLGLAGIVAVSVSATRAQTPDRARHEAAKEMMVRSGAVRQFDEAIPLIFDQMSRSFMVLVPNKAKEIREVFDQLVPRFQERKGELIDQIAGLYAAELSLQELNTIIAFYKSPVGLKFAGVQPKLVRESMILGQRWGERIGAELEQQARQELRRRGVDL